MVADVLESILALLPCKQREKIITPQQCQKHNNITTMLAFDRTVVYRIWVQLLSLVGIPQQGCMACLNAHSESQLSSGMENAHNKVAARLRSDDDPGCEWQAIPLFPSPG